MNSDDRRDWCFARQGLDTWRRMRSMSSAVRQGIARTLKGFIDAEKIGVEELIPDDAERGQFIADLGDTKTS